MKKLLLAIFLISVNSTLFCQDDLLDILDDETPESKTEDIVTATFKGTRIVNGHSIENRKECCSIRKVKPLRRALSGNQAWITGLRADQSENRNSLSKAMFDKGFDIIKFNPLLDWSLKDVNLYIEENNVPQNALHNKGFISIGCSPCTRAIKEGEDIRAGRWWWEDTSKKECGLHR